MRVIIRADGNKEIAMGHIMRCLSIADALRNAGAEVIFVTAGAESEKLITDRGYENFVLKTSFREMESELPVLRAFFEKKPAQWIVVDSYFVTERYMQEISAWCRVAYLDDMGMPVYPVSALINYNIYAKQLPYELWYREKEMPLPEKCLLGCGYAPLRAEFQQGLQSVVRKNVSDVLITTGGGDAVNAAGGLCRRLAEEIKKGLHEGIRYHVVCGPFSEYKEKLYALSDECPAFVIHENVTKMSELMGQCDIAVSATGSTMYELCSMRLPTVCFYFAENQRQMAECFGSTTEIVNAGNITKEREKVFEKLLERLSQLEKEEELRSVIRKQMSGLTDGKGAERIAEALLRIEK